MGGNENLNAAKGRKRMTGSNPVRLRSLREAAERLGVSVKCLRGWIYRRTIPYYKISRMVRISDETIQDILDRGIVPALEVKRRKNQGRR
jgi:excisionase family DNA binding protein